MNLIRRLLLVGVVALEPFSPRQVPPPPLDRIDRLGPHRLRGLAQVPVRRDHLRLVTPVESLYKIIN